MKKQQENEVNHKEEVGSITLTIKKKKKLTWIFGNFPSDIIHSSWAVY